MFAEQLILKALAALSEIADECGERPARKTLGLRFLLAYTFVAAGADPKLKWIWTDFWSHATAPMKPTQHEQSMDAYIRGTGARTALNGICREIGYPPDVDFLRRLRDQRVVTPKEPQSMTMPAFANDEPTDDNAA